APGSRAASASCARFLCRRTQFRVISLVPQSDTLPGPLEPQVTRSARLVKRPDDCFNKSSMAFESDLIYSARSLRKSPALMLVVVLTLAVGIGVNATAFNLLNLLLLAPPTAVHPERLVRIEPGNSNQISYPNYRDMQGNPAFEGMALAHMTSLNWRTGQRRGGNGP